MKSQFAKRCKEETYTKLLNIQTNDALGQQTVKHPDKMMLWDCFYYETGPFVPNAKESEFQPVFELDVLKRKTIPELNKRFSGKAYLFQHNSAMCHKSKIVARYLIYNNGKEPDWLGNSSDLNPIEN